MKNVIIVLAMLICLAGCSQADTDINNTASQDFDESKLAEIIDQSDVVCTLEAPAPMLDSQSNVTDTNTSSITDNESDYASPLEMILNDPNRSEEDKKAFRESIENYIDNQDIQPITDLNSGDSDRMTIEMEPTITGGYSSEEQPKNEIIEEVPSNGNIDIKSTGKDDIDAEINTKQEISLIQLLEKYNSLTEQSITLDDESLSEILLIGEDPAKIYITRYQLYDFLYKQAIENGLITDEPIGYINYSDSESIPDRYLQGLVSLQNIGMIKSDGTFGGHSYITSEELEEAIIKYNNLKN